ncbi:unnamed protein product, partial [Discosporangium mesarthrocarpum]
YRLYVGGSPGNYDEIFELGDDAWMSLLNDSGPEGTFYVVMEEITENFQSIFSDELILLIENQDIDRQINLSAKATSSTVTLTWDANGLRADSYVLFAGNVPNLYETSAPLDFTGTSSFYSVPTGTYYLVIIGYDAEGEELGSSEEIVVTVE